ncbi:MAG: DUF4440 domain-containing protein [Woeseiaceae bacterium]|nr:DUF4440 domain-containing protein [Woeseiaceae bacterium]
MNELLGLLRNAEIALHQPDTRRDTSQVQAVLHESFLEFGRSGTIYDRPAILDLLASEQSVGRVLSQDFELIPLGASTALLTYKSASVDESGEIHRYTLRASIWILSADGWKIRFHQATPTEAFDVTANDC